MLLAAVVPLTALGTGPPVTARELDRVNLPFSGAEGRLQLDCTHSALVVYSGQASLRLPWRVACDAAHRWSGAIVTDAASGVSVRRADGSMAPLYGIENLVPTALPHVSPDLAWLLASREYGGGPFIVSGVLDPTYVRWDLPSAFGFTHAVSWTARRAYVATSLGVFALDLRSVPPAATALTVDAAVGVVGGHRRLWVLSHLAKEGDTQYVVGNYRLRGATLESQGVWPVSVQGAVRDFTTVDDVPIVLDSAGTMAFPTLAFSWKVLPEAEIQSLVGWRGPHGSLAIAVIVDRADGYECRLVAIDGL